MPDFLGIEITRRCNLRCPHCFTESDPRAHPGPDARDLIALFPRLVTAGVRRVAFSGGEPLLRKDLEPIMAQGLSAGIESYGVVTNGSLVTVERAMSLARAGLTIAQVSIDGVDAIDHCAVRLCRPRDYYKAVRAVRLFREAGVRVDIACLLTARNLERADEMALFCEGLGVATLRYCSFVPTGRARTEEIRHLHTLAPDRVDTFLAFMRSMNAHPKRPLDLTIDHGVGPWNQTRSFRCQSGSDVAYMSAEGDLYPCPGLIFEPFKVGNVFREPVEDLFRSPAMSRVRDITRAEIGGICASCTNQNCTGGCRGMAHACFGDVRHPPPYCHVRRS